MKKILLTAFAVIIIAGTLITDPSTAEPFDIANLGEGNYSVVEVTDIGSVKPGSDGAHVIVYTLLDHEEAKRIKTFFQGHMDSAYPPGTVFESKGKGKIIAYKPEKILGTSESPLPDSRKLTP